MRTSDLFVSAGLVASLLAAPAAAVDLGFAGSGSHGANGMLGTPAGSLSGAWANSWQGSGRASVPLSLPAAPAPPTVSAPAVAVPAPPAVPVLPAIGASGAADATGSVVGTLPIGSIAGSAAGAGAVDLRGSLDSISGIAPALPAVPGLPAMPTVGSAPAPFELGGAISAIANGSVALPPAPEFSLPQIPAGIAASGGVSATASSAGTMRIGIESGASASAGGLSLPALPEAPATASASASGSAGMQAGASMSVGSAADAAMNLASQAVSAAASVSSGLAANGFSATPTLTAVAGGVTLPSLPSFSGELPVLALPEAAISVGTEAGMYGELAAPQS